MTVIKEYRVPLPITVKEYQVGQLYSVAEASKDNTGGGEGVEVVQNEPYQKGDEKGQYTFKIFRMESKVPLIMRKLLPKGSMVFHEKAWNAYPYCKTVITNPEYMKENMEVIVASWHKPDLGEIENVHNLSPEDLKNREVVDVDFVTFQPSKSDYKKEADPQIYKNPDDDSRSALKPTWLQEMKMIKKSHEDGLKMGIPEADLPKVGPHMCAYKLVTIKFKWFGIQGRMESFMHSQQRRVFSLFHRQVYCWLDKWVNMTMDDIRALEDKTKDDLAKNINEGGLKGYTANDDGAKN